MGYTLTWQNGRQLASLSGNGTTASYTYDVDGLRTSKTVNGVKHEYYYVGSRLQYEKYGTTELWFFYDADGTPSGIRYKNGDSINDYYFVCNWRGDVTEIYDSTGALAASYSYDAWGKVVSVTDASGAAITSSTHIANVNPICYRGYYYDTETSLYYLKSRYYDPQVKRFLNADGYVATGQGVVGNNSFTYCINNPVIYADYEGEMAGSLAGALTWTAAAGGSNAWNPVGWILLGVTVVIIAICVIPWDNVRRNLSKSWSRVKRSIRYAAISRAIANSVAKAKTKIRKEKRRYDYWIASYVNYGDGRGTYISTKPLSYSRAISYVRRGGNVFADSKSNAYRLAVAVGNGRKPTRPEISRDKNGSTLGYWWHYHDGRRTGGHIFYV